MCLSITLLRTLPETSPLPSLLGLFLWLLVALSLCFAIREAVLLAMESKSATPRRKLASSRSFPSTLRTNFEPVDHPKAVTE